jgi:hypothetical protein
MAVTGCPSSNLHREDIIPQASASTNKIENHQTLFQGPMKQLINPGWTGNNLNSYKIYYVNLFHAGFKINDRSYNPYR